MKLNFEILLERVKLANDDVLLETISGGTENSCHVIPPGDGVLTFPGPISGPIIFKEDGTIIRN